MRAHNKLKIMGKLKGKKLLSEEVKGVVTQKLGKKISLAFQWMNEMEKFDKFFQPLQTKVNEEEKVSNNLFRALTTQ